MEDNKLFSDIYLNFDIEEKFDISSIGCDEPIPFSNELNDEFNISYSFNLN